MKNFISASILSADFSHLEQQIRECEQAGVDWIHIDVMDGHFVPNLTMGPFIVETCKRITNLPLDCHLMVEKPESMVKAYADAGATTITIHQENNPNIHRTLQYIRSLGCQAGIALNPGTSAHSIDALFASVDLILLMTVNPGFSGQAFIPESVQKIKMIATAIALQKNPIRLEVDGGITAKTISAVQQAGADTFVSATSIFKHPDGIAGGVRDLRQALNS